MLKYVLFDLDNTLHRMDQQQFITEYIKAVCGFLGKYGYEPHRLAQSILLSTKAMIEADGTRTNAEVFWAYYGDYYGKITTDDKAYFDAFYNDIFDSLKVTCGRIEGAADAVKYINSLGLKCVLASNPVFPRIAHEKRMLWAGLELSDFAHITAFENAHYCKPNPKYYTETAEILGVPPEDCLMVGNDIKEDIVPALAAGMDAFLLPEFLLNEDKADISAFRQGTFTDLKEYIGSVVGKQ